ncbi:tripartite tricarboxylate transporter substrate binding protein [Pseudorhodoferax sp. Leaf267]|uniref:Bug family tripartite tricarboxylate transporter substrate binding protein n=1 Tax=Pseudorhodoferax sp. Leaf267 TaxID=1736316 RepID=UPI0006FD32E7|nr:tripartite tricarboxylate transporter substrate binding protein [Pseudorhodoferax sp. Leaf267]KQP20614.1 ABC transporter substrate-binding protein [Pseudorhodoferax sp. Leaf267]
MTRTTSRRTLLALGTGLVAAPFVRAQSAWPTRPIKIIVPFNAGGATDAVARMLADKLTARLGQPVIIDNKGGAGGIIGTDAVAKAAPDGQTFTVSLSTSLLINQFLYTKLPYNPQKDLALVSQLAIAPVTLVVHPSVPASNAAELRKYIQANKGKVSYGSYGIGSYAHLAGAFMSQSLDADMAHVSYKGEAPMVQDLLGGQIQMAFSSAQNTKPHIDAGKLKVIGTTGDKRMAVLPNVPTLAEQGMNDDAYRIVGWVAMAAPAKTPTEIVHRMAKEITAVFEAPDMRERIANLGFDVVAGTPEAFAAAYKKDAPVWEKLVKASGAKLD